MKLLFLSNTRSNTNPPVINLLKSWFASAAKVAYIPSSDDPTRKYFMETENWLKSIESNITLHYLDIHNNLHWQYDSVKDFDYLFISGGNTYQLRDALVKSGMDQIIKQWATETSKGIIGLSAGGIVLSSDIKIAIEENDLNSDNHAGLNLVDFGFYPHYNEEEKEKVLEEIKSFFNISDIEKVYIVPEYSGLLYENGNIKPLDNVFFMEKGMSKVQTMTL